MCDFSNLVWLITGTIAALAAVIVAAAIAMGVLAPWNVIALLAGVAAAGTAFGLVQVLIRSLQEYHDCRNRAQRASQCAFGPITGLGEGARVLAAAVLTAMITATAAGWVPVVGNLVGLVPLKIAWITSMVLMGLLTALLGMLLSYRQCRDNEELRGSEVPGTPNGPGDVGPPGGGGGFL